jgi:hypothetical protein
MSLNPLSLTKKIDALTVSGDLAALRGQRYADESNPYSGLSYIASEAIYHACGGIRSGLKVRFLDVQGCKEVHVFLVDAADKVIDPTAGQFKKKINYAAARKGSFVSTEPSVRAKKLMLLMEAK